MAFGAFNKKSTTLQTSNTSSVGQALSEVAGSAAAVNGSGNTVSLLDGGAIAQAFGFGSGAVDSAFGFAGSAIERAANLTTELVSAQKASGDAALKFAMDAGRSDVATMQDTLKTVLILAGIVAGAFVLVRWKK